MSTTRKVGIAEGLASLMEPANRVIDDQRVLSLPLVDIIPDPTQPRDHFDTASLEALAASLQLYGVMQPIVVRPQGSQYAIIAGERRFRAAVLAGFDCIPALVRCAADDAAAALALVENLQREDLQPLEISDSLDALHKRYGWTHEALAHKIGASREYVSNMLRLQACTPEVRHFLQQGQLHMGHARCLVALPPTQQTAVATLAVDRRLSVRQLERHLQKPPSPQESNVACYQAQLQQFSTQVGATKATLQYRPKGAVSLTVRFASAAELDAFLMMAAQGS